MHIPKLLHILLLARVKGASISGDGNSCAAAVTKGVPTAVSSADSSDTSCKKNYFTFINIKV